MVLTDIQALASAKAQRDQYTFLCWHQGMGRTTVALHALLERSLNVRGNRGLYLHVDPYAEYHIGNYANHILETVFKMTCQRGNSSMKFGNGSSIRIATVDQFLIMPFTYDMIVMDDSHYIDGCDRRYDELLSRIEFVDSGREDIKRVLETRVRMGEVV